MTKKAFDKIAAGAREVLAMMTSDTWPYAIDSRGYPIVSFYIDDGDGQEIRTWRSYVVLPR